jgi:hypothetical protein
MAERSRARADGMRDRASKRTMLGIAMAYETLARRADLRAAGERSAETEEKPDGVRHDVRTVGEGGGGPTALRRSVCGRFETVNSRLVIGR